MAHICLHRLFRIPSKQTTGTLEGVVWLVMNRVHAQRRKERGEMKLKRNTQGLAGERSQGRGRLFVALVVLATGGACNTAETKPQQQSTVKGSGNLAETCEVRPPFTGNFEPE